MFRFLFWFIRFQIQVDDFTMSLGNVRSFPFIPKNKCMSASEISSRLTFVILSVLKLVHSNNESETTHNFFNLLFLDISNTSANKNFKLHFKCKS